MKLCNILVDGQTRLAVLTERGAVDVSDAGLRMEDVIAGADRTALEALAETVTGLGTDLRAYCIVSQLVLGRLSDAPETAFRDPELPDVAVAVEKAHGEKCERCWIYSTGIGSDPAHPTLCPRCTRVMQGCGDAR